MSRKFFFAPIDAKDNVISKYRTVGIEREPHEETRASGAVTAEEFKLLLKVEGEYLRALKELQQRLQQLYGPQLEALPAGPDMTEDEWYELADNANFNLGQHDLYYT